MQQNEIEERLGVGVHVNRRITRAEVSRGSCHLIQRMRCEIWKIGALLTFPVAQTSVLIHNSKIRNALFRAAIPATPAAVRAHCMLCLGGILV